MQLGRRWRFGEKPPALLSSRFALLTERLAAYEQQVRGSTNDYYWTLTWLEGLPRVQAPNGDILTVDQNGNLVLLSDCRVPGVYANLNHAFDTENGLADSNKTSAAESADDDDWLVD